MKTPSDELLLAEHLKGRSDAFELIVRRHASELYRFVHRFTNSSVAADDVVQEAFLQAHLSAASFDPKRRFKPWLFTIAANKARDWIRRRNRRGEVPLDAEINTSDEGSETFADLLAAAENDDDPLEIDECKRLVRRVVSEMPAILREVLVLAYYHRFAYRDIAETLAIPVGTVKSRLHAAVANFGEEYHARVLESQHGDEGTD